jgi:hypothetical protein
MRDAAAASIIHLGGIPVTAVCNCRNITKIELPLSTLAEFTSGLDNERTDARRFPAVLLRLAGDRSTDPPPIDKAVSKLLPWSRPP